MRALLCPASLKGVLTARDAVAEVEEMVEDLEDVGENDPEAAREGAAVSR